MKYRLVGVKKYGYRGKTTFLTYDDARCALRKLFKKHILKANFKQEHPTMREMEVFGVGIANFR